MWREIYLEFNAYGYEVIRCVLEFQNAAIALHSRQSSAHLFTMFMMSVSFCNKIIGTKGIEIIYDYFLTFLKTKLLEICVTLFCVYESERKIP